MGFRPLPFVIVALALTGALAACGGGGTTTATTTRTDAHAPPPTGRQVTPPPARVNPADADVIRLWADTLRRGDARGAARYWAVPATVANDAPPQRLNSRAEIVVFNRELPCGAVVLKTTAGAGGTIVATFRLTNRPGGTGCGAGLGGLARVGFRVRGGKIVAWTRLPDPPPLPQSRA